MTDTEKQARAEEAKRLLDHPIFKEALDEAEQAAVNTWKAAEVQDMEGMLRCKYMLEAQINLRQQLVRIINAGKQME